MLISIIKNVQVTCLEIPNKRQKVTEVHRRMHNTLSAGRQTARLLQETVRLTANNCSMLNTHSVDAVTRTMTSLKTLQLCNKSLNSEHRERQSHRQKQPFRWMHHYPTAISIPRWSSLSNQWFHDTADADTAWWRQYRRWKLWQHFTQHSHVLAYKVLCK